MAELQPQEISEAWEKELKRVAYRKLEHQAMAAAVKDMPCLYDLRLSVRQAEVLLVVNKYCETQLVVVLEAPRKGKSTFPCFSLKTRSVVFLPVIPERGSVIYPTDTTSQRVKSILNSLQEKLDALAISKGVLAPDPLNAKSHKLEVEIDFVKSLPVKGATKRNMAVYSDGECWFYGETSLIQRSILSRIVKACKKRKKVANSPERTEKLTNTFQTSLYLVMDPINDKSSAS